MSIPFTERMLELLMALVMGVSTFMGAVTQAAIAPQVQGSTAQTSQIAQRTIINCSELTLFDIPLITPDLGEVECGTFQVPENWSKPEGRQISLTYVILKSTSPTPKEDPILYLEGGPGGSALTGVDAYANEIFDEMRQERDIVLFDQRGTQFSSPLVCSIFTVESLFDDSFFGGGEGSSTIELTPEFDEDQIMSDARRAVAADSRRCVHELTASGVDLRQYNSVNSANDAVALMDALGYSTYNLFGISYGTRLALVIMRDHPEAGIRSVVLDSSFPPEIPGFERFVTEAHEVVMQLFADCRVDPVCNNAYPNLKERFKTLLRTAEISPIEGNDGTTVTALDLVSVVTGISSYTESAAYIPLMIAELEQGITTTYHAIVSGSIVGEDVDLEDFDDSDSAGAVEEAPISEAAPALPATVDLDANAQAEAFIASIKARATQLPPDEGDTVLTLLTWLDKVPRTRESLETFIKESFSGETQTANREALLAELAAMSDAAVARVFTIMAESVDLIDIYTIGLNQPMFNSVECNEEAPFEDFSNVIANAEQLEIPELAFGAITFMAEQFATCEFWPSGRANDIESEPVVSDIPTLIMAGNYDFQTPVSWNRSAFVNLSASFYVQFPSSGHGVIAQSQCAKDVAREFIDTPFKQPDSSCTADLWPIWAMPSS
jgi:pimeloyl-ACP methyl ester carboxylesterase